MYCRSLWLSRSRGSRDRAVRSSVGHSNLQRLLSAGSRLSDHHCIALLLAVQVALYAVVRPFGDFPINDDWAYAHSVLWLLEERRIRLSEWIGMNLLPQTLLGGLVSALFGFSFEVLRHLTQIVAASASVAAFFWFRTCRLEPAQGLVATLFVIAMPCWPVLANSYMTDLYGLLLALLAATLLVRALEQPTVARLGMATVLVCLGVLERQVVMVVPFAFLLAWFWTRPRWSGGAALVGIVPLAAALLAEASYLAYLTAGPGIPASQSYGHGRVFRFALEIARGDGVMRAWALSNVVSIGGYLGLFLVGWAAWWGIGGKSRRLRGALVLAGIALSIVALLADWLPPYRANNVIDRAGIGPFTLYDGLPREIFSFDRSPGVLWSVAGIGAAFGVVALCGLAVATALHLARRGREAAPARVFNSVLIVAYLLPFIVTDFFDRYILFLLPFVFALWANSWPAADSVAARWQRGAAIVWLVAVLAVSAVATRDYFSWTRARWNAISAAEQMGATPETLDGGFEYNGFRSFELEPRAPSAGKSWWWVRDDLYVVAFSPLAGYQLLETFKVDALLPRSPKKILLLKRIEREQDVDRIP